MANLVAVNVSNSMDETKAVLLSNVFFDGAFAVDSDIVLSIGDAEALVNTNDLLAAINAVNAAKGETW